MQWYPYGVVSCVVGSSSGLVEALGRLVSMRTLTPALMPFLVDINVFYRVLKLIYSASHVTHNVCGALHRYPALFGVWHA